MLLGDILWYTHLRALWKGVLRIIFWGCPIYKHRDASYDMRAEFVLSRSMDLSLNPTELGPNIILKIDYTCKLTKLDPYDLTQDLRCYFDACPLILAPPIFDSAAPHYPILNGLMSHKSGNPCQESMNSINKLRHLASLSCVHKPSVPRVPREPRAELNGPKSPWGLFRSCR